MKKILSLFILILIYTNIYSSEFRASTSNSTVSVGQQFQITFSINDNGSDFKPPNFAGFKVLSGPNQSTQMSIVNGNYSRSLSISYILTAVKEGTYTISPATIKTDGNVIKSNSLSIKVLPETEAQKQQTKDAENREKNMSEQARTIIQKNLFIRLNVNKSSVFLGEPVSVTYKIYINPELQITALSPEKNPVFNGFWAQEFEFDKLEWSNEVINGANFKTAVVKKVILIPQQTGNLTIESFNWKTTARLKVQGQRNRRSMWDDFFDDPFFSGSYRDFDYIATSGSQQIKVKPLPTNSNPDFTGAVGKMSMKAWFDITKTKAYEPVTLKIQISGDGNLKLIQPPIVKFPPSFEKYDPKINDNTKVSAANISGNITFEYLAIPKSAGKYEVGPIIFTYFDLSKNSYITLKSEKFYIKVDKGSNNNQFYSGNNKESVEILDKDIRYIKLNANLGKEGNTFFGSITFFLLLILPLILFLVFIILWRKQREIAGNSQLMKNRKAASTAKKRLAKAKVFLNEKNKDKYYEELSGSIWGYLSHKLNIDMANLTKDNIYDNLTNRQIEEELIKSIAETLNICEFARYAPSQDVESDMFNTYKAAETIIIKLENSL